MKKKKHTIPVTGYPAGQATIGIGTKLDFCDPDLGHEIKGEVEDIWSFKDRKEIFIKQKNGKEYVLKIGLLA